MTGLARNALRRVGHAAAGIVPAALVAGLGVPALGALVLVAILVVAVACWVIKSKARTDRAARLLLACRGDTACLPSRRITRTPAKPKAKAG